MSSSDQLFQQALSALSSRNILAAEQLFREVLKSQPNHIGALNLLTIVLMTLERFAEAEKFIASAVSLNQSSDASYYNYGIVLKRLNKPKQALEQFDNALRLNPKASETWNNRGTTFNDIKEYEKAIADFDQAILLSSNYAEAFANKGKSLSELKRYDEALAACDKALSLTPGLAEAWLGRGNILCNLKRHDEALAAYDKALSLKPHLAEVWLARGSLLEYRMRYDEALAVYDKTLSLKPDLAGAWLGRGNNLYHLRCYKEAFAAYHEALSLEPDMAEAWLGRGNVSSHLKRYDEAFAAYDKALSLKPDLAEAWIGRGSIFFEYNLVNEALGDFQTAETLAPESVRAKVESCLSELQIVYESENDILKRRSRYEQKLNSLYNHIKTTPLSDGLSEAVVSRLPFFLAYQGQNDRDLQQLYGSMVQNVTDRAHQKITLAPKAAVGEKIRIGVVSAFFCNHTVWKLFIKGWISQFDRTRFEIFGYHLGQLRDSQTEIAASLCRRFVHHQKNADSWRKEIIADAPHIIIYPGLFMDRTSIQLASQRLAPVQCVSWGHPVTSGLDSLDYYLSSNLMEPSNAADDYIEELVRLPNLSIYYEPIEFDPVPMTRKGLGLKEGAVVFWSGQSLFKYLPQYDDVFPRIVQSSRDCQFVFIKHAGAQEITDIFQRRLERAFSKYNLKSSDHCVFLPRLNESEFVAAMGLCDIFLDSIGWSGGNTTLESLSHNLPIITFEGNFMRGRHTSAILSMMDMSETVTHDIDHYIKCSVRLASSVNERKALAEKINSKKYRVYRDRSCVHALEEFFEKVARVK